MLAERSLHCCLLTSNASGGECDVIEPKRHVLPGVILPAKFEVREIRLPPGFLIDPGLVDVRCGCAIDDESLDFGAIYPGLNGARGTIDLEFDAAPFIGRKGDAHTNARRAERRKRCVVAFAIPHENFTLPTHAEVLVFDAIVHRHECRVPVALGCVGTHVESSVKRFS